MTIIGKKPGWQHRTANDVSILFGLLARKWLSAFLAVTFILAFQTIAVADITTGLVAHYPFDGNASDRSGNGNNGIVYGASLTSDRCGNPDSAYKFDGVDDWIDFGNNPVLDIAGPDAVWSVAAWIKFQGNQYTHFLTKFDSQAHGWNATIFYSRIVGRIEEPTDRTNSFNISTTQLFSDDVWHLVYIEWNGAESIGEQAIRVFVDSVPQPTFRLAGWYGSGANYNNTANLIAGTSILQDVFFAGDIDDLRIYKRALSETEIQSLFSGDCGIQPPTANYTWMPTISTVGVSTQFTDTSTHIATAWAWDFSDGATSTEQNPAHAYASPGTYDVTLTASNDAGSSSVTKQVRVNAPPFADAGVDQAVAIGANCLAQVTLNGAASSDPDGDALTFAWSGELVNSTTATPTIPLPVGTHTISLTVTDPYGASATDRVVVTVIDTTPPVVTSTSASPSALWPPNHKMVPVTVSVAATDACSGPPSCRIVSVSSNEPPNGTGDGNTATDWEITSNLTVNLRAERSGNGNGRTYTILVECVDLAGNRTTSSTLVTVKK